MSDNNSVELAPPRAAPAEDVETGADEEQVGLVSGLRQSNRRLRRALIGTLAVVALVGASVGVYYGAFHKDDGLHVSESSDTDFKAEFVHDGTVIGVRVHNTPVSEPNRLDWSFDFEGAGRTVDYQLDMEARVMHLDGHSTVLSREERSALNALQGDLAAWVATQSGTRQGTLNVGLLERASDYLSQAPDGYEIPARRFNMGGGVAQEPVSGEEQDAASPDELRAGVEAWEQDDGVTCLTWGGVHQARFDGEDGSNWYWNHVVGTDSVCTGRCGAKCNWLDKEAFQDCMDHDLCVTHFGGSVLIGNADCGDEFGHAADDYIASYGWFC